MTDIDIEAPEKLEPHVLPIVTWPDERLHIECHDIVIFDRWIEQHALDLFATMKANDGIGLASPQVSIIANVIAIWIEEDKPMLLVNPEILEADGDDFEWEEGCLSVPGYFEKRKRPSRVIVAYKDVTGKDHEAEFHGLYAFAIQHEIDHLRGRLFVDKLSTFKKTRVKKKVEKTLKKQK